MRAYPDCGSWIPNRPKLDHLLAEHQATAFMTGLTYELNSGIKDVDVNPGNRLSLEWGVSQYFNSWFEFTIHGAHNWQITDDTGTDVFWDPAAHDRKNSLMLNVTFLTNLLHGR